MTTDDDTAPATATPATTTPAPLARFKDLCIDAVDVERSARFWAAALGLSIRRREGSVWLADDDDPARTIWINQVPEPRTVKNRAHLDVHTGSVAELEDLGAQLLRPPGANRRWTVLADPDGQDFCAFVRSEVPDYRFYELVVDAVDPKAITRWWAELTGATAEFGGTGEAGEEFWYFALPGAPFESMVFGAVPEPKAVKNRVHWDVVGDPDQIVAAGARLLRAKGGDLGWHVLSDPEGNEFCVFD